MAKDRKHHFHEGAGNPIMGYNLDDGVICRDCGSNNPEMATYDPKEINPIYLDDLGSNPRTVHISPNIVAHMENAYPDGFTCDGCGDVIGAWDYKGDRHHGKTD